jgi:quaternary ammonium compound-resistance protein SugE
LNGWLALLAAGLFEIAWALGLKYSDGLTRFWPTAATVLAIAASFGLMALALKSLPFGTAYAVWTGIGAAGAIVIGILAFGEPADPLRLACLALIVTGIIGLKLGSAA